MALTPRERWIAIGLSVAVGAYALDAVLLSPLTERLAVADKAVDDDTLALTEANGLFTNQNLANRRWRELTGTTLKSDFSAAESQLLNRVGELAQAAGLTLDSLKPERNERQKDFQRMTYRAATTGNMRQTSRFLDSLRTADIPLRVTDVQISSRRDGTDDLAMQAGIATIHVLPAEPAKAGTR